MTRVGSRARKDVARCTAGDITELRVFQSEQYAERAAHLPTAHLEWLFAGNPHGSSEELGIWIARKRGAIVGQQAEMPFALHVPGTTFTSAAEIELMVDPVWRLHGVGPALSEAAYANHRVVCGFGMSTDATRMYVRAGWIDLGSLDRYVLPLRFSAPGTRGARAIAQRGLVGLSALGITGLARARARTTRRVAVEQFDERADEVWAAARASHEILASRTAEDLRWRYDRGPHARLYRRFYLERGGKVFAYLVLRERVGPWGKELQIVDYLAPDRRLPQVFAHCVLIGRAGGYTRLKLIARHRGARSVLRRSGFLVVKGGEGFRFMIHLDAADSLRTFLSQPDRWFLTSGDGDIEFLDESTRDLRAETSSL